MEIISRLSARRHVIKWRRENKRREEVMSRSCVGSSVQTQKDTKKKGEEKGKRKKSCGKFSIIHNLSVFISHHHLQLHAMDTTMKRNEKFFFISFHRSGIGDELRKLLVALTVPCLEGELDCRRGFCVDSLFAVCNVSWIIVIESSAVPTLCLGWWRWRYLFKFRMSTARAAAAAVSSECH